MRLTPESFAQLCKLARLQPASNGTRAARLVLVDGMRPRDAAALLDIPQAQVNNATTGARKAAALAVAVAAGVAVGE